MPSRPGSLMQKNLRWDSTNDDRRREIGLPACQESVLYNMLYLCLVNHPLEHDDGLRLEGYVCLQDVSTIDTSSTVEWLALASDLQSTGGLEAGPLLGLPLPQRTCRQ